MVSFLYPQGITSGMDRVKTIDEIYSEVSDCSLVITNDVALMTALNARVDRPMIGTFAATPRGIASLCAMEILGEPMKSDMALVRAICDDTGYDFRTVHGEVQNIRQIRRYTADVRKYMATKVSRKVLDSFESLPTIEMAMSSFDPERSPFFTEQKGEIAVVGAEFFDDLDKHFIPYDCRFVDIFADGDFGIEEIREVGNDREIAVNMADLIGADNADDCAVVLDASSPIADSVRSALYSRGIPFYNKLGVRDLAQIRDYLQFVTLSLSFDILHVRDVRELYSNYNGFFLPGLDMYLLSKLDAADARERGTELIALMRDARSMTFGEMREKLCDRRAKIQVGIVLEDLGLSDRRITGELVGELRYAVDNFPDLRHNEEVPIEEKSGVLIADCKNSVFVDRSLIFFLDMDASWDISVAGMRYADSEAEAEKNAMRMAALLQQGERRIYMVNATKYGRPARPALTFDVLCGKPAESFADISGCIVKGRWHADREEIRQDLGEERLEDAETIIGAFSKSAFNCYFSCPRMYFFSRIISSPETDVADFGNLVHDFAQLYICYPEIVRQEGFDRLVDIASDRYSGLSTPLMEKIDRDRIYCAMRNVARYIDSRHIGPVPLDRPADEKHVNRFFERYGLDRWSSASEVGAISRDHPMYGKFDAVAPGAVMDFKTGKAKTGDDIRRGMSSEIPSRYPEFQPIIYSLLAEENGGRKDLEMFYAMENDWESMGDGYDINRSVRTVRLMDESLEEIIRSDALLRRQMEEKLAKEFRECAEEVLAAVAETSRGLPASEWDGNPSVIGAVLDAAGLKSTETNIKKASAAVRKIAKAVSEGMVSDGETVEISLEARNEFLDMLERMHGEAVEYACGSYPARPRVRCEDCRYFPACTADRTDAGEETVE